MNHIVTRSLYVSIIPSPHPIKLFMYFCIKNDLNTCLVTGIMKGESYLKIFHLINDLINRSYFLQN